MKVRTLANRKKINGVFRNYLYGSVCGSLVYPIGYVVVTLALFASSINQVLATVSFDFAKSARLWAILLGHFALLSLGPAGTIGVMVGLVIHQLRRSKLDALSPVTLNRARDHIACLILSGIGWLTCVLWPLSDLALTPPP